MKLFLSLLDDCLKLKTSDLLYTINETLYDVYEAQIKYTESCIRGDMNLEVKYIYFFKYTVITSIFFILAKGICEEKCRFPSRIVLKFSATEV